MPLTPTKDAGWRIEPPVSVPVAAGARHAATAAAEPPELPPGTARDVPRVLHRAEGRVLVRRAHRELVHVGLAEEHRAGAIELLDHVRVVGRDEVREDLRAARRAPALGAEEILVRDRECR